MLWVKGKDAQRVLLVAIIVMLGASSVPAIMALMSAAFVPPTPLGYNPPISAIDLRMDATPKTLIHGVPEDLQVSVSISIRGGPGPVTVSWSIPDEGIGGGTIDGSLTVMLDRNATYAFNLPLQQFEFDTLGSRTFTVSAQAGSVNVSRSVTINVL
jgi:hypothetical protein